VRLQKNKPTPSVLFCTPFLNYPPKGGPELRSYNSIKALAAISNIQVARIVYPGQSSDESLKLDLRNIGVSDFFEIIAPKHQLIVSLKYCGYKKRASQAVNVLFQLVTFYHFRRFKNISEEIIRIARDRPDLVIWISFANLFVPAISRIKKKNRSMKIVSDTDSVWSSFILRGVPYKPIPKRIFSLVLGNHKRYEEKKMVRLSDIVTAVSEVDQEKYQEMSNNTNKILCAYNVIDLDFYQVPVTNDQGAQRKVVLLAGSFGQKHSPMDHGARWFINEVWPMIKASRHDAVLHIVGKGSETFLETLPENGIFVHGKVESIVSFMAEATVSIVPLWFESGTRFKILEAGALFTPVVTTSLGAEGLLVSNCNDLIQADSPVKFAQGVLHFLNQVPHDLKANNLNKVIRENYDLETLQLQCLKIFEKLQI
jgi:glycosyltransferase involved in cell wall biosynthesis